MRKVNTLKNASSSSSSQHTTTCLNYPDIALCPGYCQCNSCVLKSLSPKPNGDDLSEFLGKDLEELVYSVVLLIIEGRTFTQADKDKESLHSNLAINSLLNKVNQTIKKNTFRISNASQLKSSHQPVMRNLHSCLNQSNIQVGKSILFIYI